MMPPAPPMVFETALLPDGWARDVGVSIGEQGVIDEVTVGAGAAGATALPGALIPGMANLHCHAFQRAMAGLGERRSASGDSFWSWREAMYAFAAHVTPEDLEAIAAQLYVEMLKAGYTGVAEFHYLHHDADGAPYGDRAVMSRAVLSAADRAGIGLTLLPTLYMTGGFDGRPAAHEQRRFVHDLDGFAALLSRLSSDVAGRPLVKLGLALHSLRAVPPGAMRDLLDGARGVAAEGPIHIHVAEQIKEVEDCLARHGRRPVEWLLENCDIDERWCLVHATHMTGPEVEGVAASGAVVGLCPTTEANLGDGLFPMSAYLKAGGGFGIGSDSNASVSPIEELRWLEFGQRLASRERNVCASDDEPNVGDRLWRAAVKGGARATARPAGVIAPGYQADLLVLDPQSPLLAGRTGKLISDSLVFSGNVSPVRDVMVAGKWVVRDYCHAGEKAIGTGFRQSVERLIEAAGYV